MRRQVQVAIAAIAVVLLALGAGAALLDRARLGREIDLSKALTEAESGVVRSATLDDGRRLLVIHRRDGSKAHASYPKDFGDDVSTRLLAARVDVRATSVGRLPDVTQAAIVALLLLAAVVIIGPRLQGRLRVGAFARGRGEAVEVPETRFVDVAGVDEAVDELKEIVEFLHRPERFKQAGARLPHGALLVGPPGTGKTLLARAVAGEAGVPFFSLSGSDFVETFVGVGAHRVRDVFQRARRNGRAILFIDELDAVGKARGGGGDNGAADEREHTLNQLLVEMDGFAHSGVIVLAATNRADVLDSALTRPGRFDRTIHVGTPDRRGRTRILELHARDRELDAEVDLVGLARRTPGMTGADLAQLINQAALCAARDGRSVIAQTHFEDALATTVLGRERKGGLATERDRKITAWHEAGHALAALVLPDAQNPVQVTIIPRGPAGGVTWMSGSDDSMITRREVHARLVVAMSGRAGEEELLEGDYSQGAAGDFASATQLAWQMVTEWGMSPLGVVRLTPELLAAGTLADRVHEAVDAICADALDLARALVSANRHFLDAIAEALLVDETLALDELRHIQEMTAAA